MSKVIRGRIQSKRDTTANWNATQNFIPLDGEIIVYTDYYGENTPAIKVGDGKTVVQKLGLLGFEPKWDNFPLSFVEDLSEDGKEEILYINTTNASAYIWNDSKHKYQEIEYTLLPDLSNRVTTLEAHEVETQQTIEEIQQEIETLDSDKHFTYRQSTASDVWVITHNLGKYPSITVVDSAGTVVVGEIILQTTEQAVIRFNSSFSGKAYCN